MRIALLTKEALDEWTPFSRARRRLIEFLSSDNNVGIITYRPPADMLSTFDLGIGFYYPHILSREEFEAPRYGTVNCHQSYLPQGRGSAPNVFSIVYGLQSGVTIHKMSDKVDGGDILYQKEVPVYITDTGQSLYFRLLDASLEAIETWWHQCKKQIEQCGRIEGIEQHITIYTKTYRMKDLEKLDDLESYFGKATAHQFVDILRARTFEGHEAAWIKDENGKKVYVRIKLDYA